MKKTSDRPLIVALRAVIILVLSCVSLPLHAAQAASPQLVQFTAAGHALGFGPEGMYAASGSHALRVDFLGGRARPLADNSSSGSGQAASLGRVVYPDLWPGISLTYESLPDGIYTTTYTLAPGADPERIRLRYNVPVTLDLGGALHIAFETGVMTESAPLAWQEIAGERVMVNVSFRVRGAQVGFSLGEYDPRYTLTIDPTLTWNTFQGCSGTDEGYGIAVDGSGNVYVAGYSAATWGSPLRAFAGGAYDAFVAKLDPSGNLAWNTFLGGSGEDRGRAIAVDGNGNVYVAGQSASTWGSPLRAFAGGVSDAFVAKLSSSGSLTWNTFLGGSGSGKLDEGHGIAVDANGNVFVTGRSTSTWGSPVRAYSNGMDAFTAKLSSSGSLTWNTFSGGSGDDWGYDVTVDGSGNVYVAGYSTATWGSPVRSYTGANDAFAVKLTSSGSLAWSTFLGCSVADQAYGIAVDGGGNVYVVGTSNATWGSPLRAHSGFSDAFAAKLSSSGSLAWNTFLGGSTADNGYGVFVDDGGNLYIAGTSASTWSLPERAHSGSYDAFAAKLSATGSLTWNTFLGSSGYDNGYAIDVDGSGNIYLSGSSDKTWGGPVRAYTGSYDSFVAKLGSSFPTVVAINRAGASPTSAASVDFTVTFSESVTGVDAGDFSLFATGLTGASVSGVSGSGATYTVTASTGSGSGTLRLDLADNDSILDALGVPLGGAGAGNGNFNSGQVYNVDRIPPVVSSILRASANPTSAASVDFTVTFSESVTGVDASDFALTVTGLTGASVSGVSGSGATYTVTASTGSGSGTLRLDLADNDSILDVLGNPLGGAGTGNGNYSAGETYTVSTITVTFADVPQDYWAWNYIERLYATGITGGCGVNPLVYCPGSVVTRAQMAIFLERGMNGSTYVPPAGTGLIFGDVPVNYWAVNWIEKLAADGITGGCGGGNYCPENAVTRAHMAVFLLRAKYGSAYTPPAATGVFADVPTTYWAAGWIEQLAAEGVTAGCGVGVYCPESAVTRDQMAVFLVRTFGLP